MKNLITFSKVLTLSKVVCLSVMISAAGSLPAFASDGNKGTNETVIEEFETEIEVMIEVVDEATGLSEAMATKPEWIRTTAKVSVVKRDDSKTLLMSVTYKNNNKAGKIVTAIFDKTIRLVGTLTYGGGYTKSYDRKTTFSKVESVNIYPGQSHVSKYYFDIRKGAQFSDYEWKQALNGTLTFSMERWTHDCQVKASN